MAKISQSSADHSTDDDGSDSDSDSSNSNSNSDSNDDIDDDELKNLEEDTVQSSDPPVNNPDPSDVLTANDDHAKSNQQSDVEEGQVSSDNSDSSDSSDSSASDSEFNDGFDENLMGNEADRLRLENLSEKERETEIFKRIERRDLMRTRWEIERKLKLAKRVNRARDEAAESIRSRKPERKTKDAKAVSSHVQAANAFKVPPAPVQAPTAQPSALQPVHQPPKFVPTLDKSMFEPMDFNDSGDDHESHEYFDPKERSKERKKNVEMNRTDDKRSSAMALLKAKREGKQKRGEFVVEF